MHRNGDSGRDLESLGRISAQLSPKRNGGIPDSSSIDREQSSRLGVDLDNLTTYTDRSKLIEIQGFDSPNSKHSSDIRTKSPEKQKKGLSEIEGRHPEHQSKTCESTAKSSW